MVGFIIFSLTSLHFAQNYPSNVSRTLQSWWTTFSQTSLVLWHNVLYQTYEKSLRVVKINCTSSVSKHGQDQVTDSCVSTLPRGYIDNVSKQICCSHDLTAFLSLVKPRNCVLHPSLYDIDGSKNVITWKHEWLLELLMGAKLWYLEKMSDFLYSSTKTSFPPWFFSSYVIILCALSLCPLCFP